MIIGKAGNNWIYFTAHDQDEPTHAHANWPRRVETDSAKIWVFRNGDTEIVSWGKLSEKEMKIVCNFFKG